MLVAAAPAQAEQPVTPYVVGGRDATEAYPWMGAILHPHPQTGEYLSYCGGTLIAPGKILTAGHCAVMFSVNITQVRVGSHDWTRGGTLATVAGIDVHPRYDADGSSPGHDLAVLHLDRAVSHDTLRLARTSGDVGDASRIIGWGATCDYGTPQWPCYPDGLKEADVRIVADRECSWFNRRTDLCVRGDDGQMACYGDSGGPLLRKNKGRWELVGVTHGDGDADAGTNPACSHGLGIWADATKYRSWIGAMVDKPLPDVSIQPVPGDGHTRQGDVALAG